MIQYGGFFILAALGLCALLVVAVVMAGSVGGRGVGAGLSALFRNWNHLCDNLEEQVLALDFYRLEEGYDSTKPLILCKDGGLMALYEMSGLDPEPISEQELAFASNAIRRGVEAFGTANLEGRWKGGFFEVQQYYLRRRKSPPRLEKPHRDSEVLSFLSDKLYEFWEARETYDDRLYWAVKFYPKFKDKEWMRLRSPRSKVKLLAAQLEDEAAMVRRHLKIFEENVNAFSILRPRMAFALKPLGEQGAYEVMYEMTNKKENGDPPPLNPNRTLLSQVCFSTRTDVPGKHYQINERPSKILTWKNPPTHSMPNTFTRFQKNCQFPFTMVQIFRGVDFKEQQSWLQRNINFGTALGSKSKAASVWVEEAVDYEGCITTEGAHAFNWYFSMVVEGESIAEMEDRASKLGSQMKVIFGAEPMEEVAHRLLAELSTIPGNGILNQRRNVISSKNIGHLAAVYRLGDGDTKPHMLFGDRKNGVFSYSVFTPREPSWNKAVLGLPGSGKSVLIGEILRSVAMYPCQIYVIDRGNSYGPFFEFLRSESPDLVSVQRFQSGDFKFNPFPMAWAMKEREKQQTEGTYRTALPDGSTLSCPVEAAQTFFENWLCGLVADNPDGLTPTQKNRVDRALKGGDAAGDAGFFKEFENQCETYLNAQGFGREVPPPKPLTELLTPMRNECPEFVDTIELWTRGLRGSFFDSGQDTMSSAKYMYFELEGIDKDPMLAAPFVSALMGSIWARITDPRHLRERKVIVIDEAWSFLGHPAFASVIDMMFRTIRKFNGFVVLATQTPGDIMKGKSRDLLQCMAEQFIYPGFSEPTYFKEDLLLANHQVELHKSLRQDAQKREVFYWTKSGLTRALDVVLTPEDYWIVTTNANDKDWRNAFVRHFGSLRLGVEKLVEACGNMTLPNEETRLSRVKAYAEQNRIAVWSL